MYGCQRAMGGNLSGAERKVRNLALSRTLLVSLLLSLGVHSVLLFLPVVHMGKYADVRAAAGKRATHRLQVRLVQLGEVRHQNDIEAVAKVVPTAVSRRPVEEKSLPLTGVPAVLPDKEPELVSEIDSEIAAPRIRGFMILHLQIDNVGLVGGSEVIYSELPQAATDLLVQRFVSARFKPAVRNGQIAESSILLRVDVE